MRTTGRNVISLPCPPGEAPTSWLILQGKSLRVGAVDCPARHPRWQRSNDVTGGPGWAVVIFPRRHLRLEPHAGGGGIVDPGRAILFQEGETYDRTCLDPSGDRSEWFGFNNDLLSLLLPGFDPADLAGPRLPRRFSVSARDFALQRRAYRNALLAPAPDHLLLEEAFCAVLESLRRSAAPGRDGRVVERLLELLAARYREPLGLADLARELGVSAPHLCRVFRRETGGTIHDHRERLRFAAALETFEAGAADLTDLALDLGYSSHAHFTANFTQSLGRSPSRLRAAIQGGSLEA
jgi:AraC-like DNA-binding protein